MVNRGFKLVIGSWKIMPISFPWTPRISLRDFPKRSSPSRRIASASIFALSSKSLMMESMLTLLPQPDSPTIPRLSPFSTEKEIPRTADTFPADVSNQVWRFFTSSKCWLMDRSSKNHFFSLGSRASLSPSPIKFRAKMVMLMAKAGNSI